MTESAWWWPIASQGDDLSQPHAVTLLGRSLVLWQAQDHTVSLLNDRCPHRGAQLSLGQGHGNALQCPYHGWMFELDGRVRNARGMDGTEEFDTDAMRLPEFRVGTIALAWDPSTARLTLEFRDDMSEDAEGEAPPPINDAPVGPDVLRADADPERLVRSYPDTSELTARLAARVGRPLEPRRRPGGARAGDRCAEPERRPRAGAVVSRAHGGAREAHRHADGKASRRQEICSACLICATATNDRSLVTCGDIGLSKVQPKKTDK